MKDAAWELGILSSGTGFSSEVLENRRPPWLDRSQGPFSPVSHSDQPNVPCGESHKQEVKAVAFHLLL